MPDILKDYYEALERLKKGKPINVPKGTKITNDSVSLEAGRKKGTIKKSRPIFCDLIADISAASKAKVKPDDDMRSQLDEAKANATRYRVLWEEALAREVSLVKQIWEERDVWAKERTALSGGKVIPIRKTETK